MVHKILYQNKKMSMEKKQSGVQDNTQFFCNITELST